MTNEDRERILERIRKMLRLAGDKSASEGERDNAMRMARATLEKYNLDMAEVERGKPQPSDRGILKATFYGRPWARAIAGSVASLCFCEYLYIPATRGNETVHIYVGREANAITAVELARYLVDSVHREANAYRRKYGIGNDSYRAFAWGAVAAIANRVYALRAEAETPAPSQAGGGKALIAYQASEDSANAEVVAKAFPKLRNGRSGRGIHDVLATQHGREFGETVSLNRQVSGPSESDRFRLTKEA
jgi:hypothetical protein